MGNIANMVTRWSDTINVSIASAKDKYNQSTYSNSTIQGRLVMSTNTDKADVKHGVDTNVKAKLFTSTELNLDDKVEGYMITGMKECKNRYGVVEFYKYILGENKTLLK